MPKEVWMPKYQSNVYHFKMYESVSSIYYKYHHVNHLWGYSLFLVYGLWASTMTIARICIRVIDRN